MNTKLTLRLDDRLIDRAKRYSNRSGKSVSQLVSDYFALIEADEPIPGTDSACARDDRFAQGRVHH